MTANPYTWAPAYLAAGWPNVLPLPAGRKHPPPTGYTGADGKTPTDDEYAAWASHDGNIALRMPPSVIGLDVDAYDGKPGLATLAKLTDDHGDLPNTWASTSRTDGSGIHYYRIPAGIRLIGALPGLEVVQHHHRYAVAPPSVHPNGATYRWVGPGGELADQPPSIDDLPDLPASWLDHLRADAHTPIERRQLATDDRTAPAVDRAFGEAIRGLSKGTRHDAALAGATTLTRLASLDYPGAQSALDDLGRMFTASIADRCNEREADAEWRRIVDSAATLVATTPSQAPAWEPLPPPPDAAALGLLELAEPAGGEVGAPDTAGDWSPVPLGDILGGTHEPPQPTILTPVVGPALLYPGRVNSIFGESGTGKTWVALAAVAETLNAGGSAMLIDLEDTPHGIVSRLRAMGIDHAAILERFTYLSPHTGWGPVAQAAVAQLIDDRRPELVIVDSTGEAMAASGTKGNDDDDVARWFVSFPKFIARRGPAVLIIDHVPKDPNAPSTYAIGSQRKIAAIDGAAYRVEAVKVPSKIEDGRLRIICAKDRHGNHTKGQTAGEITIEHDGTGGVALTLNGPHAPAKNEDGTNRPTIYMERVSRALEECEGLSQRELKKRVVGKDKFIGEALGVLITEGYVEASPVARGFSYRSVRPFRESEDLVSSEFIPEGTAARGPTAAHRGPDPLGRGAKTTAAPAPSPTGQGRGRGPAHDTKNETTAAPWSAFVEAPVENLTTLAPEEDL